MQARGESDAGHAAAACPGNVLKSGSVAEGAAAMTFVILCLIGALVYRHRHARAASAMTLDGQPPPVAIERATLL